MVEKLPEGSIWIDTCGLDTLSPWIALEVTTSSANVKSMSRPDVVGLITSSIMPRYQIQGYQITSSMGYQSENEIDGYYD